MTTHYYSTIFNTKINKWVWGTFDIFIERVTTLVSLCGSPCFLACRILTGVCEDEFHSVRHSWGLRSHWMLFSVSDTDRSLWRQIWMCQRQPMSPFSSVLFSVPDTDSLWRQIWMCQRQPMYWQRYMKTSLNVSETADVLTEVYEDQSECVRNSRGLHSICFLVCWILTEVYENKSKCVRDTPKSPSASSLASSCLLCTHTPKTGCVL